MNTRKTSTNLHNIDKLATNISIRKLQQDSCGILRMIQQGATWDRSLTAKFGYHGTTQCEHCGLLNADYAHITWFCPSLEPQRKALI